VTTPGAVRTPGTRYAAINVTPAWVAVGIAFVLGHGGVLRQLVWQWQGNDVYSYAFLILPISAYMLWTKRDSIRAVEPAPAWTAGLTLLLGGLSMLVLGTAGVFSTLQELSLIPTLFGIVLLMGGTRLTGVVWLPLAYLALTIPIWDMFTDRLHWPFQLLSARVAGVLLAILRVPCYRVGSVLQLPSVTLEVARACSGVNYLVSIVAIAVPYAYFSLASPLRRIAVVGIAVILAAVSNGVRVAFIGALQYYGFSGQADLHGPNHVLQGMFVAVVGYLALFLVAWLLRDRSESSASPASAPSLGNRRMKLPAVVPAVTVTAIVLAAVAPVDATSRAVPLNVTTPFPAALDDWLRSPGTAPDSGVRADAPDSEFFAAYTKAGVGTIHVYIAYFASQRAERKLVGQGGVRLPDARHSVAIDLNGAAVKVAAASERAGPDTRPILAWFDIDGTITPNPYVAKMLLVRHAILHRRSNGAVVGLTLSAAPGLPRARATEELRTFAARFLPLARAALRTER
jgi:EpsI family protein